MNGFQVRKKIPRGSPIFFFDDAKQDVFSSDGSDGCVGLWPGFNSRTEWFQRGQSQGSCTQWFAAALKMFIDHV